MRNLIENASHYSPEGGVIEVQGRPAERAVEITVADRGTGIPEADLPRTAGLGKVRRRDTG